VVQLQISGGVIRPVVEEIKKEEKEIVDVVKKDSKDNSLESSPTTPERVGPTAAIRRLFERRRNKDSS